MLGVAPEDVTHESGLALVDDELAIDDVEHRVLVRGPNDFEYQGQRFKSLTAIARHITGTPWSGPAFFGLKTKDGRKEPV